MIITSRDANLAGRGTRNASRKSFPRPFSNPLKVPLFRRQRRVARRFLRSCLPMTDSFPPTIAPQADSSGNAPESAQTSPDPTEPVPITEQEVGEYREQDRYLPVSPVHPSPPPPPPLRVSGTTLTIVVFSFPIPAAAGVDRKRVAHHEKCGPTHRQNREGRQGVRAGVRVGIHQLHHVRGGGEVPAREAQDDRRRGHTVRDGLARL